MTRIFSLIVLLLLAGSVAAQNKKQANKYFLAGNFELALDEYAALAEIQPENLLFQYRLAVCYLNTNISKTKAIPCLEKVISAKKFDANALFLLGRAYHFNMEFDNAIAAYNRFLETKDGNAENKKEAGRQIDYCQNAKELVKFPIEVEFENLGQGINSAYQEYLPFVPVNESFLLFTTRRNDGSNVRPNGLFYSNIYYSKSENGKFTRPVPLEINTPDQDENLVGLSNNGEVAVFYRETPESIGDLFFLSKKDGKFSVFNRIDPKVNTSYTEIAATISADSSSIIFASNMPGGFGGIDLYICRRLPNGKWSDPQNLGPSVNTIYDEDFPSISPDGKTLYFSSKGHTSMGGYDLFYATYNEEKNRFMQVRSMGYPLNTPGDDMNLRISENGKYGYIAAVRPEGFGDLDIYRVNFKDAESQFTVIKGYIKSTDSTARPEAVFITVSNKTTGEIMGEYQPNQRNGRYVIILPPGNYSLMIEAEGFSGRMEDLEVYGMESYQFEVLRDFILTPEK
ncbi:MAG: tetratricopeptide repeat protein [Flavobacteriales bacterium]|nr:tetratricopeptide repeat protein [Flavobacteriales bacterium]